MDTGKRTARAVYWILFAAYLFLLFYFLFFSKMFGRSSIGEEYKINPNLFQEIRRYIRHPKELGIGMVIVNLAGNVLAFMPFGYLWPLLWKRWMNGLATTLCAFSLSISVETIQLLTRRGCFDVDDILLNTVGGLLGYLVCMLFYKNKRGKSR